MLIELAETEKVKGDNIRASSYFKAAAEVKKFDVAIMTGKQASDNIKGVGKKIAEKIDELLSTGTLARLERSRCRTSIFSAAVDASARRDLEAHLESQQAAALDMQHCSRAWMERAAAERRSERRQPRASDA